MGIITVTSEGRQYTHELDFHISKRRSELPIENLHAVFLESAGRHLSSAQKIENQLNEHGIFWKGVPRGHIGTRLKDTISRAEKNGIEIWLGDVDTKTVEDIIEVGSLVVPIFLSAGIGHVVASKMTRREALKTLGVMLGVAAENTAILLPPLSLARKGDASQKVVMRRITEVEGKISPNIYIRNAIMCHKIKALAEKTGHRKIGILTGAGHVGMATLLEKGAALTPEARAKIALRGADALKMFRCIYDKQAGKWGVEEHSL